MNYVTWNPCVNVFKMIMIFDWRYVCVFLGKECLLVCVDDNYTDRNIFSSLFEKIYLFFYKDKYFPLLLLILFPFYVVKIISSFLHEG